MLPRRFKERSGSVARTTLKERSGSVARTTLKERSGSVVRPQAGGIAPSTDVGTSHRAL
jgi:hypothetical protein